MKTRQPPQPNRQRILVVDDDPDMVASLTRLLKMRTFEVSQAFGARQAVELASQFHPDVVLMDIKMPDMDGIEAFARMKRVHPELAAIFMSGSTELMAQARAAGATSVLQKPLDPKRLFEALEWLGQQKREPAMA